MFGLENNWLPEFFFSTFPQHNQEFIQVVLRIEPYVTSANKNYCVLKSFSDTTRVRSNQPLTSPPRPSHQCNVWPDKFQPESRSKFYVQTTGCLGSVLNTGFFIIIYKGLEEFLLSVNRLIISPGSLDIGGYRDIWEVLSIVQIKERSNTFPNHLNLIRTHQAQVCSRI